MCACVCHFYVLFYSILYILFFALSKLHTLIPLSQATLLLFPLFLHSPSEAMPLGSLIQSYSSLVLLLHIPSSTYSSCPYVLHSVLSLELWTRQAGVVPRFFLLCCCSQSGSFGPMCVHTDCPKLNSPALQHTPPCVLFTEVPFLWSICVMRLLISYGHGKKTRIQYLPQSSSKVTVMISVNP